MTNVVSHAGFDIVLGHARSVASLQLNRTLGAKVGVVHQNWYGTVEHIRSTWSTYESGVEPLTCPGACTESLRGGRQRKQFGGPNGIRTRVSALRGRAHG